MSNDWKPAVPDINKDFRRSGQTSSRPVTKAELDQLKSERSRPALADRKLTIGGQIEKTVHQRTNAAIERRIKRIEQRLEKLKDRSKKSFNRAADRRRSRDKDSGISR